MNDSDIKELEQGEYDEYWQDAMVERKGLIEEFGEAEKRRDVKRMTEIARIFSKESQDQEDLELRIEGVQEKEDMQDDSWMENIHGHVGEIAQKIKKQL